MAITAPTRSAGAGPCWLRAEFRRIRHHGSGIGLSVVRLLIEAMGGLSAGGRPPRRWC